MVLPTPPLPAPTAMTFFTPGRGNAPFSGALTDRTCAVMVMSTSDTPGSARTSSSACAFIRSLTGTGGGRELDGKGNPAAVDREILDESERDDVAPQVGVHHPLERIQNCFGSHV